jgi:hypothetical protein
MAAQKKRTPRLLVGEALKEAVLTLCREEYERIFYEAWDPKRYPDWVSLQGAFDVRKNIERLCREIKSALDELRQLGSEHLGWALDEWVDEALRGVDELRPDEPPATLHGFIIQMVERGEVPREVPIDRRTKEAKRAPPEIYWRTGPGRYRAPTNREIAFVTLLIGCWPLMQPSTPTSAEDVVRQEAKAIASARRRHPDSTK